MQMGVAGHQDVLVALALLLQLPEEGLYVLGHQLQLTACEELQVHQHLVVARTARVDFLAHIAQAARQQQLHLGVDIFDALFDGELSVLYLAVDVAQFGQQGLQLVGR